MTRTSSRPCSMSRLTSGSAGAKLGKKLRQRRRRAVVVAQGKIEKFVDGVGGFRAEAVQHSSRAPPSRSRMPEKNSKGGVKSALARQRFKRFGRGFVSGVGFGAIEQRRP